MTPRTSTTRPDDNSVETLISTSYFGMRTSLGVLALAFPFVLLLGQKAIVGNGPLPDSISSYFHTEMRTFWTISLGLIAGFLYLYKGQDRSENVALNIASIGVLGVIFFPCAPDAGSTIPAYSSPQVHGAAAFLAFGALGVVAVVFAGRTVERIPDDRSRSRFRRWYQVLGLAMIGLPLAGWAMWGLLQWQHQLFWTESAAVLVFGVYWLVKTAEFKQIKAAHPALSDEPPTSPTHPAFAA